MRGEKEAGELSHAPNGPGCGGIREGVHKIKTPCVHSLKRDNRSIQAHSSKGSDAGFDSAGSLYGGEHRAKANHHSGGRHGACAR